MERTLLKDCLFTMPTTPAKQIPCPFLLRKNILEVHHILTEMSECYKRGKENGLLKSKNL